MKNFFAKLFKIDKRKEQRFQIDDHDLIIFDPNAPQEKQILDLSMKGISFIYTDEGKRLNKIFELDIKVGDVFHLGKVRVKIISDVAVSEFVMKSKAIRRVNARFINFEAVNEYELEKFLKEYGKPLEPSESL